MLIFSSALTVQAQEREYEFNIHEPTLEQALIHLATQADLALYMPSALTQNLASKPLVGKFSLAEALLLLLAGTDIQFELSQRKVLVLTPKIPESTRYRSGIDSDRVDEVIEILVISELKNRSRVLHQSSNLVIDATELDRLNVINLLDINRTVPGLQMKRIGEHNIPNIYLRGISAFDHTEAGEQSIAYYTDGVLSPRAQGATTLLYDIDRVEVLRGPQAARRGKAAIGGVIHIHNNGPDRELYSTLNVTANSKQRLGTSLAINIPLRQQWAVRLAGAAEKQAGDIGFAEADVNNSRRYGAVDMNSLRVSSRYSPSAEQNLMAFYEYFSDQGTGRIPTQSPKGLGDSAPAPGSLDLTQEAIRLRWNSYYSELGNLTYIAGASQFEQTQIWAPGQTQTINRKPWSSNKTLHQELSLSRAVMLSSGKELNFALGAFYYLEKNAIRFDLQHEDRQGDEGAPAHRQTSYVQPDRGGYTGSLYGELALPLAADWFIDLSLRYSYNKRYDQGGRNLFCSEYISGPLPEAAAQLSAVTDELCWVAAYNDVRGEWNKVMGSVTAGKNFGVNHSFYFSLAKGWKPGSVSDGVDSSTTQGTLDRQANQQNLLQPERSWILEAGMKNCYFDQRLYIQSSLFVMDHKDIQELVYTGESGRDPFKRSNGARSFSVGAELKSEYSMASQWRMSGALSLISARYRKFLTRDEIFLDKGSYWNDCVKSSDTGQCRENGELDLAGNRVPFTPTVALNASILKVFHVTNWGDITPSVNVTFQSDMYFSAENRAERPAGLIDPGDPGEAEFDMQKSYGLIDLDVEYLAKGKNWGVQFFVKNVTNQIVKEGIEINTDFYRSAYYWGARRIIGLRYFSSL